MGSELVGGNVLKKKYNDVFPLEFETSSHVLLTRFGIGVFDERWLSFRLDIFEAITLPSVVSQNSARLVWFIFVDSFAPEFFLSRLNAIAVKYDFIKIVQIDFYFQYFDVSSDICEMLLNKNKKILISKIDDDDSLHFNTFSTLYKTFDNNENCVYTFPDGYELLLQERLVLKCNRPFLTHNTHFKINDGRLLDILRVGHHNIKGYCDRKEVEVEMIKDNTSYYLYTRHKQSDSNFSAVRKAILGDASSRKITQKIYNDFSIDKDRYLKLREECKKVPSSPKQKTWRLNADLNKKAEKKYKELSLIKKEIISNGSDVF